MLATAMRQVFSEAMEQAIEPVNENMTRVKQRLDVVEEDLTELKSGMTDIKDYITANPKQP